MPLIFGGIENMVVVSIVKLSELEGTYRMDGEYYQPAYLNFINSLKKTGNITTFKKIGCEVVSGPFGSSLKSEAYRKTGIPFIRIQNLQDLFITNEELVFISKEDHRRLKSSQLKVGDIVLSKVGNTIGVVSIITSDIGECNISENNIGIKFKNHNGRLKKYLAVYLNTKYGRNQILRLISGNAQPKLNVYDIYNLALFIPRELSIIKEIASKVDSIHKAYKLSIILYSQAENLLLEELELKDFKPKYEKTYTANLFKAFKVNRLDAEYFQPAYGEVVKKIIEYPDGYTQLLNCVENVKPDFDPSKYPDTTFSYIELANIDSSIGVIHSTSEIKGEEAPSRARRILRKNEVIVSSVEGSLEKVALVDEEHEDSLASTGFFQFRAKNIFPEVLLVLSKSIIVKSQLKKECSGTILTAVPNKALKRIIIPNILQQTQQKITSLVQQSHEARRKAKELLEEAKRKVEKAIENEIKK